jgi:transmembrane 9 superfamily protein 3
MLKPRFDLKRCIKRFLISENVASTVYCTQPLSKKDYKMLVYAIKNHYWYQMYLDDLPIWAIVGEKNDDQFTVWTHR